MNGSILLVHYVTGFLVVLLAALFVWRKLGRRVMIYVLTLQIVLGIVLIVNHLRAPSYHYAMAIVAWLGYMVANALGRRGNRNLVLAVTVISTLLVLVTFYVGQRAVQHG